MFNFKVKHAKVFCHVSVLHFKIKLSNISNLAYPGLSFFLSLSLTPSLTELCDMACYFAGSSHQRMDVVIKGLDMVSNNSQVGCGV